MCEVSLTSLVERAAIELDKARKGNGERKGRISLSYSDAEVSELLAGLQQRGSVEIAPHSAHSASPSTHQPKIHKLEISGKDPSDMI